MVGVGLGGDQRQQRGARGGDRGERRQHDPPAVAQRDQQPDRLDPDREEGEVVAAEGERRGQRPERRGRGRARVSSARTKKRKRERAEEDQQRVGAGLLRVPDQHRVEGEEAGEDEADAAARAAGGRSGSRPGR